MKKLTLDARGLPCPRPLLKAKEALEQESFGLLEVLVDNPAARENVSRFLGKSGMADVAAEEHGPGCWLIRARSPQEGLPPPSAQAPSSPAGTPAPDPSGAAGGLLLIAADSIGRGDPTLGALLMKGFLYSLTQGDSLPAGIIFMNSGASLACTGSESLADLQTLEERGCPLLVCGTCLDYLGLSDELAVGRVGNMYEIAGLLTESPKTLSLC